jgi:hypothetical protein
MGDIERIILLLMTLDAVYLIKWGHKNEEHLYIGIALLVIGILLIVIIRGARSTFKKTKNGLGGGSIDYKRILKYITTSKPTTKDTQKTQEAFSNVVSLIQKKNIKPGKILLFFILLTFIPSLVAFIVNNRNFLKDIDLSKITTVTTSTIDVSKSTENIIQANYDKSDSGAPFKLKRKGLEQIVFPYNKKWGDLAHEFALYDGPYADSNHSSETVYFGYATYEPNTKKWHRSHFLQTISGQTLQKTFESTYCKKQVVNNVIIKKDCNYRDDIKKINGLEVLEQLIKTNYTKSEYSFDRRYIVIGKKYNYIISPTTYNPITTSTLGYEALMTIKLTD